MRRALLSLSLALSLGLVSGCGDDGGDTTPPKTNQTRPLDTDEADRLAVVRLNNYTRQFAPVRISVTVEDQDLVLEGRVDFRNHLGLVSLTATNPPSQALLTWNLQNAGLHPGAFTEVPATPPQDGWQVRELTTTNELDSALQIVLNLALDRPENAQLLRQNGAEWRGETTLDGTKVDLMTARGDATGQTLTYYVDAKGNALRVDAENAGADRPTVIEILPGESPKVPAVRAIR